MDIVQENTARHVLRNLYGGGFQLRGLGSQSSAVFVAEFSDGREAVVLKLPRNKGDELVREQRILDALETIHVPVTPLLYTQENHPVDALVYTVTRYIHGPDLGQVLAAEDERTEAIFAQVGCP
jgi:Ser/Thr protein kinase RdoA (MazF antagonist)